MPISVWLINSKKDDMITLSDTKIDISADYACVHFYSDTIEVGHRYCYIFGEMAP